MTISLYPSIPIARFDTSLSPEGYSIDFGPHLGLELVKFLQVDFASVFVPKFCESHYFTPTNIGTNLHINFAKT